MDQKHYKETSITRNPLTQAPQLQLGIVQSCKLLRYLGTSCPVGLETSSRILMVYSAFFAVNRIFKTNIFFNFWTDFRDFWAD